MITKIKLINFLCHKETELTLSEGLTVFLGRNGAGKSSVIDAITYALYGRHTRGDKINIVRDRSGGGRVELEFVHKGRRYRLVRSFNSRGDLENAALWEDGVPLVVGERKRDDSVSKRVEQLLELDYDRMKAAVIIQQGELDKILSAEPRELKNLFDNLMGLDVMERAYQEMYQILKSFEERVRNEIGRPIQDADTIHDEIKDLELSLKEDEERKELLQNETTMLEDKLVKIEARLKELEKAEHLFNELRLKLEKLKNMIVERLQQIKSFLQVLAKKKEVEDRIRKVEELDSKRSEIIKTLGVLEGKKYELENMIEELSRQTTGVDIDLYKVKSLDEFLKDARVKAEKLRDDSIEFGIHIARFGTQYNLLRHQIDTEIEEIVQLVSEAYTSSLKSYTMNILKKRDELKKELQEVRQKISELNNLLNIISDERDTLIKVDGEDIFWLSEQIRKMEVEFRTIYNLEKLGPPNKLLEEIEVKVERLEKIIDKREMPDTSLIEEVSIILKGEERQFVLEIRNMILELVSKKFDLEELKKVEKERDELIIELNKRKGALEEVKEKIEETKRKLEGLRKIKENLLMAKKFHESLEKIRDDLFYRDGVVLKSLRTLILNKVTDYVRKYLDIFDVRIDDVKIVEETRTITFKCYYRGKEVDVKRLSGGEKIALSLALRLAIGDVLGAQKIGFFILDEPTIHLDSENKRKLLNIFSNLGKVIKQSIIITHDDEIFEGAELKTIRFERGFSLDDATVIYEST
jgi:exonuclease SbcC